ncbi:hypothetical protein RRG08_064288 [Elysia crispata]|uniref:Phospholipase A2-like central domain-containing protein n=1 Tax=Elysia crispata TaxID=231223 RepID=A0AAE1D3R6_9GAST|nr:hypothetical protein RRG08_064288 [Elysia crispata]
MKFQIKSTSTLSICIASVSANDSISPIITSAQISFYTLPLLHTVLVTLQWRILPNLWRCSLRKWFKKQLTLLLLKDNLAKITTLLPPRPLNSFPYLPQLVSKRKISNFAFCLGAALVFSRICVPVASLVYTDGDLAVLVIDSEGDTNSSCIVHSARNGMFLSQFLESRNVSEVMEVDTDTVNKMATECSHESSGFTSEAHRVKKRSIFNIFRGIYPGTKWCGIGNIADDPTDLGYYKKTDRCCQQHDSCAHYIPARRRRYGVHNDSPFTVSSCACDIKFRDCLQDVGSFVSQAIEFFFFKWGNLKCLTAVNTSTSLGTETRRAVLMPVRALATPKRKPQTSIWGYFRTWFGRGDTPS